MKQTDYRLHLPDLQPSRSISFKSVRVPECGVTFLSSMDEEDYYEPVTSSRWGITTVLIMTGIAVVSFVLSRHNWWNATFISAVHLVFLFLFLSVHALETTPTTSRNYERLKAPVWFLFSLLNFMTAYALHAFFSTPALLYCIWAFQALNAAAVFYSLHFFLWDQ